MVIWFFVCVVVLLVAGAYKVRDPAPTASALHSLGIGVAPGMVVALGVLEITAATFALVFGGMPAGWLVASFYLGFALFVTRAMRSANPVPSCGCFGEVDRPPDVGHLVIDLAAAAGAAWYATDDGPSFADAVTAGAPAAPITVGVTLIGAFVVIRLIGGGKRSRHTQ